MKIDKTNSKRLLWAVMAASLLGMAGCYSDGGPAMSLRPKGYRSMVPTQRGYSDGSPAMSLRPAPNQDIIASDSYQAATRNFNPKWPYGQESQ